MGSFEGSSQVDMSGAGSQVWLMKVPNFLLEHWASKDDKPTDLGVVSEVDGDDGKKKLSLHLSEDAGYPAEWPRDFDMSLNAPPVPMYVFSRERDAQGAGKGPVRLDGAIDRKGELKPPLSQAYRSMVRNRKAKAEERPQALALQEDDVEAIRRKKRGTLQVRPDKRDREGDAAKREEKRVKAEVAVLTPGELRQKVFECFSQQQFWNKRDLDQAVGQKAPDVKKVLDLIAERVSVGKHKGEYQLKPEYRDA